MLKYIGSIWFWWATLSVVYITLNLAGYPLDQSEMRYKYVGTGPMTEISVIDDPTFEDITLTTFLARQPVEGVFTFTAAFIGLFVPYGIYAGSHFLFSFLSWISVPIFLLLMYFTDKKMKGLNISGTKRVLAILFALLVITTVVDFVRGTPFESWKILLQGGFPHYCC